MSVCHNVGAENIKAVGVMCKEVVNGSLGLVTLLLVMV